MPAANHLRETLRWSHEEPTDWAAMAAAGLGIVVPLVIAASLGHLSIGLAGAAGSLLMGNGSDGRTVADLARSEAKVLATLFAALVMMAVIAGHGLWSEAALVLIVACAGVAGGYSRQMAITSGRFIVFSVMTFSIVHDHAIGLAIFPVILACALWTSALILGFGAMARAIAPPAGLALPVDARAPTRAQLLARWRQSLRTLKGWQFPLRMVIGLGLALIIAQGWPEHRFFWIALTVALVCQRPLDPWPLRTTQRALGTLAGVIFAGLALGQPMPDWVLIGLLGVLSFLRLGVQTRNYLVFSALMTPVIMLILDAGKPIDDALLIDRLLATLIGVALVIAVNWAVARVVGR